MGRTCMLLVLLLGSITAEAQLSSLRATVLEGGERVCPDEEQLETARATIDQDVRALLRNLTSMTRENYIDCRDAYEQGKMQSGIYTIQPDSEPAFQAYCDMHTDGGGWTVFQRRQDGSQDFFLYWTDYENGFGNFSNEFWLGLAQMHRLTASTARTELRVDLETFSSTTGYAQYTDFGIGDASSNHTLMATGYSGTAGESLNADFGLGPGVHHNQPFTTRDRDNDNSHGRNCAQAFMGAWWYDDCFYANLNGFYFSTPTHSSQGVTWYSFTNINSLKFSEMKLRRA